MSPVRRTQSLEDVRARRYLAEVLDLLPRLQVVVLLGSAARRAWDLAQPAVAVPVLRCPRTGWRRTTDRLTSVCPWSQWRRAGYEGRHPPSCLGGNVRP